MAVVLVWEKARQDAVSILDAYWTSTFPVDPERIASAMGMAVYTQPLPAISGMLRVEPSRRPEIYVDANDAPQRQRFTIAHELGHYFERTERGDRDFNFIDRRGGEYDLHEFYADEFAGTLLMPQFEVVEQRAAGWSLPRLAAYFDVSLPAMRKRLERLGLAE